MNPDGVSHESGIAMKKAVLVELGVNFRVDAEGAMQVDQMTLVDLRAYGLS